MINQKNFSIGACTLVPQITRPSCARDVIVDKVHGAVNPTEPQWFDINIQDDWRHHHMMKSLPHETDSKQQQWNRIDLEIVFNVPDLV